MNTDKDTTLLIAGFAMVSEAMMSRRFDDKRSGEVINYACQLLIDFSNQTMDLCRGVDDPAGKAWVSKWLSERPADDYMALLQLRQLIETILTGMEVDRLAKMQLESDLAAVSQTSPDVSKN